MKTDLWDSSEAHAAGSFGAVAIAVWYETRDIHVRAFGQTIHRLAQQHSRIAILNVVDRDHPPSMPSDAREEFGRIMARGAEYICCEAVVFEDDGFRAAMVRAIVTGLNLMSRSPFPHHVFQTASAGGAWVLQHVDPTGGQSALPALLGAVEQVRRSARRDAPYEG